MSLSSFSLSTCCSRLLASCGSRFLRASSCAFALPFTQDRSLFVFLPSLVSSQDKPKGWHSKIRPLAKSSIAALGKARTTGLRSFPRSFPTLNFASVFLDFASALLKKNFGPLARKIKK